MKGILQGILNNALGSLVENISENQLHISITKGKVELNNVKIKPSFFSGFSFPFDVIYGQVSSILVKYSLLSIGSKPIQIFIDGFNAFLKLF